MFLILVPVLLLACGGQQKPVAEQPLPFTFDENLLQIDSLMQHDADSALQTLLSFRAQRGTPSTFKPTISLSSFPRPSTKHTIRN
jgi:hypothetical protein